MRASRVLALVIGALASVPCGPARADDCSARLFVIERSKNSNIVVYDANRGADGEWNASEPVIAYWLLNGEKDRREELNRVERERAYGVQAKPGHHAGTWTLSFKARKGRRVTVLIRNGCAVATTSIGGRDGILRRVFVRSTEGFGLPKVDSVELFGEDLENGAALHEKFVPK